MLCKFAECTFHFSFNLPLAFSCVYLCADCVSSLLSTFKCLFWPAKHQVIKGYMCVQKVDNPSRNYEIINSFVLNIFTKPIFCLKVPQKVKSCSRLLEPQKVAPKLPSTIGTELLSINLTIWHYDNINHHVTVTIKLYLNVGTDERDVLCSFGGRITSSFKDIERDLWSSPPLSHAAKENAPSE